MIESYGLTETGMRIAKNPHNPDNPSYRIISFLYKIPRASKDMIADYCGLTTAETSVTLRALKAKRIVAEESEVSL